MEILPGESRTLGEYLLLPNETPEDCTADRVDLTTPLVRHRVGECAPLTIATPLLSAIMEAVSGPRLAVALAQCGGLSFVHQNQPVATQVEDIAAVKRHKAGFRPAVVALKPTATLDEVTRVVGESGAEHVAVTGDGTVGGPLLGLIGPGDFHRDRHAGVDAVTTRMRAVGDLLTARVGVSLGDANALLWDRRADVLAVLDGAGVLDSVVLRRDYDTHKRFRNESVDALKRLRVAAGINTRDHRERVPALVEAGADLLCIDSSDGYTVYQARVLEDVRSAHGGAVHVGAGNVVDARAFEYLADAGAAYIKVGIGGGSICTTRAQKGIGRGQASALLDVARARDAYAQRTGEYVPLVCDGGVLEDSHMAIALAMGADAIMLGRYFARCDESPTRRVRVGGQDYKEYWGEGSTRARNTARYEHHEDSGSVPFAEGVDGLVPYAGSLSDAVAMTTSKIRATMVSCGATSLPAFRESARAVVVSEASFRQTGAEVMVRPSTDRVG